jgi:hypothetical protein
MATAMQEAYGQPMTSLGQGGSIPLCNVFEETYPDAEIILIGVEEPRPSSTPPTRAWTPRDRSHGPDRGLFLERYAHMPSLRTSGEGVPKQGRRVLQAGAGDPDRCRHVRGPGHRPGTPSRDSEAGVGQQPEHRQPATEAETSSLSPRHTRGFVGVAGIEPTPRRTTPWCTIRERICLTTQSGERHHATPQSVQLLMERSHTNQNDWLDAKASTPGPRCTRGPRRPLRGERCARTARTRPLNDALTVNLLRRRCGSRACMDHAGGRLVRKAADLDDRCGGVDKGLPAVPGELAQLLAGLSGSDSEEFHDGAFGLPDSCGPARPSDPRVLRCEGRRRPRYTACPRVRGGTRADPERRPRGSTGFVGKDQRGNGTNRRCNGAYEGRDSAGCRTCRPRLQGGPRIAAEGSGSPE